MAFIIRIQNHLVCVAPVIIRKTYRYLPVIISEYRACRGAALLSLLAIVKRSKPLMAPMIHHPRLPVLVHHLGSVLRVMLPIPKPILKRRRAHGKPLVFRQIRICPVRSLHERPVSDRLLPDGRLFLLDKRAVRR